MKLNRNIKKDEIIFKPRKENDQNEIQYFTG